MALAQADDYSICKQVKTNATTHHIPIIVFADENVVTDEVRGFENGIVDYITKPISAALVLARINTHLEINNLKALLRNQNNLYDHEAQQRAAALMTTQFVLIRAMAYLAEIRDSVTGNHILRVQHYIKTLAEKLRFHPRFEHFLNNDDTIELLSNAAPLHDIGAVGIPDRILLKPDRLTATEFDTMKNHTRLGQNVLLYAERDLNIESPFLKHAKEMIYSHHEKWDGSGYPEGLVGDEIPISARLIAIADVYDALISRRVYKPLVPHERAVEIILESKGTQFDADMVDAFYEVHEEFRCIARTYPDNTQDFNKKIDYLEAALAVAP
jgi:putative two-component system response regulator